MTKIVKNTKTNSYIFKGIPSSTGLAMGKVFLIRYDLGNNSQSNKSTSNTTKTKKLPKSKIESEVKRFNQIVDKVKLDLTNLIEKSQKEFKHITNIIESSLFILEDPYFLESINNQIVDGFNCEEAIIKEIEKQKQFFKKSKDFILREKASEFDEIKNLLLLTYKNINIDQDIPQDSIVISQSINPSQVVRLKEKQIKGVITELGGLGSHSSILCRSFEIPQVIGVNNICSKIKNNDEIIIDGFSGEIILNPNEEQIKIYQNKINELKLHKNTIGQLAKLKSTTLDGRDIPILSNIDLSEEIDKALVNGAEGFGLVRSESMMLMRDNIPNEDEQYEWYCQLAERAYPLKLTIRLFDFGSDKYTEGYAIKEENPALGLRGIRYLLARPHILQSQIRAILRASKNNNIQVMVPMVTQLEEFLEVKNKFKEISRELQDSEIDYDTMIKIGTMIETPSAALISDDLANYSDFFSIGTNDLVQYIMAADRGNQYVTNIYDFFQPAVIRSINQIVLNAHSKGKPVSICGDIASHLSATKLLAGLGIDELSVIPSALIETKMRIRNISVARAIELSDKVLTLQKSSQIRSLLGME